MKTLKKIRLINWHRFTNETIEMADACLLSGENGAGKSTILDAIQLVVTATKNNFNKAAHDKGKRTLNTYIRCKTGREDRPYERTGELSAHVALEFFDEARNQPFIIGCVMDSASEEKEPNVVWYLMEKQELNDDMFFKGQQVRSISSFHASNKGIKQWANTQKQAQAMILQRFGRLEDKFFTLIPKALAFKPISDIKDFVYSYVLDEKEVNIDALRENVRSYQDLHRTLEDVKKRITELEQITARHDQVDNCIRIDRYQEYYIERAGQDMIREGMKNHINSIRSAEIRKKDFENRIQDLTKQMDARQEMITSLSVELNSNADYQAYMELEKKKAALETELEADKKAVADLQKSVRTARSRTQLLRGQEELTGPLDACIEYYLDDMDHLMELESLVELRTRLEEVVEYKKKLQTDLMTRKTQKELEISRKEEEHQKLLHQISELEKKKLIYPDNVLRLRRAISDELIRSGREDDVRILCELLEITEPAWQNAVEGYLNTQRFYLLVGQDNYDLAVSAYDKMRREGKVYGAGLINAAGLDRYDQPAEDSLAARVTSVSQDARRYINMILGKVICCKSYQDLKNHPVSITRECMRYQNHVVSAIDPKIFKTPYIGAHAYEIQLEQKRKEEAELAASIKNVRTETDSMDKLLSHIDVVTDLNLGYQLSYLEKFRADKASLQKVKEDMTAVGQDKSFIEKQIHLNQLQEEKKALEGQKEQVYIQIGSCQSDMDHAREGIRRLESEEADVAARIAYLVQKLGDSWQDCEATYQKELSKRTSLQAFKTGFEAARKANQTTKEKYLQAMTDLMHDYKVAHDFGAPATYEGYESFKNEYDQLKESRLLEYEDKVEQARRSAEEEFREQFLSKLQENIKQAQAEFRQLNRSLQDIHFAHEKYEFLHSPKSSMQKYYSMIMDNFNVLDGESIFSGVFNEAHKEVIEELFDKLALDEDASQETLVQFTDYRFYMDYDIKITSDDGSYMYYSKVSREKSGGETQTPFYITVAASFMQLYRNSIGGDSVGLVMMDEAFNNMDDERIQGVLAFMKNSDLQLIISAPPEKIQYIGPAMDKVLLVLADGNQSYVEDFSHETI